ncbi:MAG: patatin-like phospholipase family protein [Nostocoides sp.]
MVKRFVRRSPADRVDARLRASALRRWAPPAEPGSRALVLGGGGATGIAWLGGLLIGLRDLGLDLTDADTMIGTSAGAVVAAHARTGDDLEEGFASFLGGQVAVPSAAFRTRDAARFMVAQALPGQARSGRALLGRAGVRAAHRARSATEEAWVAAVGHDLAGKPWPEGRLLITAVDALTGTSVVFDNDSGVPLERAMAASCAVPGIYPPVHVNGRAYVDGGVRTVTNADLARGHERVIVLAPIPYAVKRADRPRELLATLGPHVRSAVVAPDRAAVHAMGRDLLDLSRVGDAADAGRAQAARVVGRLHPVWLDEPA